MTMRGQLDRGSRVLVVEDDAAIRNILREALRDEGYDVAAARDGAEGLTLLSRWHPDVMVLDLGLPKVAGEELARESRHASPEPTTVVVSAEPAAPRIAIELGLPYMRKPFDLDDLLALVAAASRQGN